MGQSLGGSLLFVFILFILFPACLGYVVLDSTNNTALWTPNGGLSRVQSSPSPSYPYSLCWNNTVSYTSVSKTLNQNWTTYGSLFFSMYHNGQGSTLYLILDSDYNGGDYDYYFYPIQLNWVGWKSFSIPLSSFGISRNPAGMGRIKSMYFAATGWSMNNSPLTAVCFNGFELGPAAASFLTVDFTYSLIPSYTHSSIPLIIVNPAKTAGTYRISYASIPSGYTYLFSSTPSGTTSSTLTVTYTTTSPTNVTFYATLRSTNAVGSSAKVVVQLFSTSDLTRAVSAFTTSLQVVTFTPLPSGITSMKTDMTGTGFKAASANSQIATAASRITSDRSVFQAWGAWGGYFFCNDGTSLIFDNMNNTHFYCPSEKRYYTGEPYSKAWYTYKHNQVISYTQDLALGYFLTGNTTYADAVIATLLQYSVFYPSFPFRDINEQSGTSGGRFLSQTLDESNVTPLLAIAFDLVAPRMTATQQAIIEYNLLRSIGLTMSRNRAGLSNWQSWHNAAFAIIGYVVNDPSLVTRATNDSSNGFYYQLSNAISDDGFHWENSIGYHFYTLQAMQWLLSVCARRNNSLSNAAVLRLDGRGTKTIESMYIAPIQITEPLKNGWGLPSLNDDHSSTSYISGQASLYVFANWQWGHSGKTPSQNKNAYSWVLGQASTPTIPNLLWGAPVSSGSFTPGSADLLATGLTILNQNATDWLLLKHGPHGGYHGHYDKLELLFDHAQQILLDDYGTVEYTQPLHYNYFKRTLAHNSILVDGITQQEADGDSLFFGTSLPDFLVMSANSTAIYPGVAAQRTVLLFPNLDLTGRSFVVDLLEPIKLNSTSHDYFSVYHSAGNFQVKVGPAGTNYNIPYTSVDPSWGYFTNAKSANVSAKAALRYSWTVSPLTVQDGFESLDGWLPASVYVTLSTTNVKEGTYSLKWTNQLSAGQIQKTNVVTDWSATAYITWWMYNVASNNAIITVVLYSENSTSSGIDYYAYRITLNWTGWKLFNISRATFFPTRSPIGWNKIDSIVWSATWAGTPLNTSEVYIDAFHVYRQDGSLIPDIDGGGLEIVADTNAPARQFITASAPNQPATSYHPVAVTKISGEALFSHLLISPSLGTTTIISFNSTLTQSTYSLHTINVVTGSSSILARVYTLQGGAAEKSSVRGGVRVDITRSGSTSTSGYKVGFLSPVSVTDTNIGISGSQVTGKIYSYSLSATKCNLTVSVYDSPAYVLCKFSSSTSSFFAYGSVNGTSIGASSLVTSSAANGQSILY